MTLRRCLCDIILHDVDHTCAVNQTKTTKICLFFSMANNLNFSRTCSRKRELTITIMEHGKFCSQVCLSFWTVYLGGQTLFDVDARPVVRSIVFGRNVSWGPRIGWYVHCVKYSCVASLMLVRIFGSTVNKVDEKTLLSLFTTRWYK